jgi:hypothetical protein
VTVPYQLPNVATKIVDLIVIKFFSQRFIASLSASLVGSPFIPAVRFSVRFASLLATAVFTGSTVVPTNIHAGFIAV